ncbi:MAG: leucine-rich repeat protein [Blautia sp.]|nr:leucine-rich repeat protein [Blautia sp.]
MAEKRPFRAYAGSNPYIFISYSHKDAALVYPLIEELFLNGYNIWYDQGIPNNALLDLEISQKIRDCDLFLLFLSPNSVRSEYVIGKELPAAQKRDKSILFVRLDEGNYRNVCGNTPVLSWENLLPKLPAACRECEKRDPAPIEVDLSAGIELVNDELTGFSYFINNGKMLLTGFFLTEEMEEDYEETGELDLIVPDRHAGFPLYGIAPGAFDKDEEDAGVITSITLPDYMESLGDAAFNQSSIRQIHLPAMLQYIDMDCFGECYELNRIDLPYGLKDIARDAFWNCDSLEELIVPETVKHIGSGAFDGCTGLRFAAIAPGTTELDTDIFGDLGYYEEEDDPEPDEDTFRILCVKDSAAHRYAVENSYYFQLISEKEMETRFQAPLRQKHEAAMERIRKQNQEAVLNEMFSSEGPYACLLVSDKDREKLDELLLQLAEDGYRIRLSEGVNTAIAENSSTMLIMLSSGNTEDASLIQAIANGSKPVFPLMLDDSPVPSALGSRFILHVSDRSKEDLLNEIREHLILHGCKGNPRNAQSQTSLFTDPRFDYQIDNDGDLTLTACKIRESDIVLPDELFGKPVTKLGNRLFTNRTDLVRIKAGSHVESIGALAFAGCTSLKEVVLPPSVKRILSDAFSRCPADLVIRTEPDTYAAEFAAKAGFTVKRE